MTLSYVLDPLRGAHFESRLCSFPRLVSLTVSLRIAFACRLACYNTTVYLRGCDSHHSHSHQHCLRPKKVGTSALTLWTGFLATPNRSYQDRMLQATCQTVFPSGCYREAIIYLYVGPSLQALPVLTLYPAKVAPDNRMRILPVLR